MAHLFYLDCRPMGTRLLKEKFVALLCHLVFSFFLAGLLSAAVFIFWFPSVYYIFGAADGMLIFIGIDLVLGPLLTFVVYNSSKRELRRDLAVVVVIQLSAFLFGVWTIYQQSPFVQVLTHKNISIYSRSDFENLGVTLPNSSKETYVRPHKFFMYLPENLSEIESIEFVSEFVEQKPFGARVDLYRPFSQSQQWGLSAILARFVYDEDHRCYWADVSSKHFMGEGCIDGQTGKIVLLK